MAFKLKVPSARARVEYRPKTASVAIGEGAVVYTTSGKVSAISAASDERIAGVSLRAVASTDSDYASNTLIPILMDEDGIWEATLSSSTNTITPGTYLDFSDSVNVHVTNSTYDQFLCVASGSNVAKTTGKLTRWEGSETPVEN